MVSWRTLHDGDGGGGVEVDRVHGGEEAEGRTERVMAVMAAVAAAEGGGGAGWAGNVEEQGVVEEGRALDPATTNRYHRGTAAAHLGGKLKRRFMYLSHAPTGLRAKHK